MNIPTTPRRWIALALPAGLLSFASVSAQSTWTGAAGASWANPGSWSPAPPAPGDNLVIADITTGSALNLDTSHAIGSFTYGDTGTRAGLFDVTTGANVLTIAGGIVANGNFGVSGLATLTGNITFSAPQTIHVGGEAGTIAMDRGFRISTETANGNNTLVFDADVTKLGLGMLGIQGVNLSGAGNLLIGEGSVKINLGANRTLTKIGGSGNIQLFGSSTLHVVRNSGLTLDMTRDVVLNDTATLSVGNGALTIASDIAWNGTSHSLAVSGATANASFTGGFSGAAAINRSGVGLLSLAGDSSAYTGTLSNTGGVTRIEGVFGGSLLLAGGGITLTGAGPVVGNVTTGLTTASTSTLTLQSGSAIIAGALVVNGALTLVIDGSVPSGGTVLSYGALVTDTAAPENHITVQAPPNLAVTAVHITGTSITVDYITLTTLYRIAPSGRAAVGLYDPSLVAITQVAHTSGTPATALPGTGPINRFDNNDVNQTGHLSFQSGAGTFQVDSQAALDSQYWTFSVFADSGYRLDPSNLIFEIRRATGADGVSTGTDRMIEVWVTVDGAPFVYSAGGYRVSKNLVRGRTGGLHDTVLIDLSGPAFQNARCLTFRVYNPTTTTSFHAVEFSDMRLFGNTEFVGGSRYDDWLAGHGVTPGNPGTGPDENVDGSDVKNLLQFALGGNPADPADNGVQRVFTKDASNADNLVLTVAVPFGTYFSGSPTPSSTFDGVTYSVQGTIDLVDWTAPVQVVPVQTGGTLAAPAGYVLQSFRLVQSPALGSHGFLRLRTVKP